MAGLQRGSLGRLRARVAGYLLACLLVSSGCLNLPESYPPPVQRHYDFPLDDSLLDEFVAMNEPEAPLHFVKDISPYLEAGSWRWAYAKPELRFKLPPGKRWQFLVELALPEVVFSSTGPVRLSILVQDTTLARPILEKPGHYKLVSDVPDRLVQEGGVVHVRLLPDKYYVAPADNQPLSFILLRAGFIEK